MIEDKDDLEAYMDFAKIKFYYTLMSGVASLGSFTFIWAIIALSSIMELWRIALFGLFILIFTFGCIHSVKMALYVRKLMKALLAGDKELYYTLLKEHK